MNTAALQHAIETTVSTLIGEPPHPDVRLDANCQQRPAQHISQEESGNHREAECVPCGVNQIAVENYCDDCERNEISVGDTCEPCPYGEHFDPNTLGCEPCPENMGRNPNTDALRYERCPMDATSMMANVTNRCEVQELSASQGTAADEIWISICALMWKRVFLIQFFHFGSSSWCHVLSCLSTLTAKKNRYVFVCTNGALQFCVIWNSFCMTTERCFLSMKLT